MTQAHLLLIDDHTLFRTGLRLLLADSSIVASIAEAGDIMEAVQRHAGADIDLILLDIQMPGLNGIEGIKVLRRHFAQARILIVSGTSRPESLPREAAREVAGFLPKSADAAQIERAIAHCMAGGGHIDERRAAPAIPVTAQRTRSLTPRQLEVLGQLALGRSNKVIAHHLGLSENTVRVHVAAILDHFGVVSRIEAILEAQRRGMIRSTP
ncbi:LuxR family two component transcriptional regulator [Cupriavidus gilardii J11]|uniref:LuxR family two component transcriptional regulator n=1 Tax=Cupriavidus gilardii J11 TaxID=936133 RepID=A0A562BQV7_9BURK|nr:response regulator transcription factor [Cupriavidus gilardii]TWG87280.1 LuxR family two component transcriptional regulator [Cupriavidus gilardii J11]